jgi:hypothetical protein
MKRIAVAAVFLGAALNTASAETWRIVDGAPKGLTNMWQVDMQGEKLTASAGVVSPGGPGGGTQRVSFSGVMLKGEYHLAMPASAAGPACNIVGKLEKQDEIVGVVTCGGKTTLWRAHRM